MGRASLHTQELALFHAPHHRRDILPAQVGFRAERELCLIQRESMICATVLLARFRGEGRLGVGAGLFFSPATNRD
jgi:hypothetical protein